MIDILIYYPYLDGTTISLIDTYYNLRNYLSSSKFINPLQNSFRSNLLINPCNIQDNHSDNSKNSPYDSSNSKTDYLINPHDKYVYDSHTSNDSHIRCNIVVDSKNIKTNVEYFLALKRSLPRDFQYTVIPLEKLYEKKFDKLIMSFGFFRFLDTYPHKIKQLYLLDAGRIIHDYYVEHGEHIKYVIHEYSEIYNFLYILSYVHFHQTSNKRLLPISRIEKERNLYLKILHQKIKKEDIFDIFYQYNFHEIYETVFKGSSFRSKHGLDETGIVSLKNIETLSESILGGQEGISELESMYQYLYKFIYIQHSGEKKERYCIYGNEANEKLIRKVEQYAEYKRYYHTFSKERFQKLKELNTTSEVVQVKDREKTGNIKFQHLLAKELKYHRWRKVIEGVYAENIGKMIFEFSALGKRVYYSRENKTQDDGLTEYLKLFGLDDNIDQEIKISEEELFDKLGMKDDDILLIDLLKER